MDDNKLSVLQHATNADVRAGPFPHILLHNALPDELCAALISSYPALDALDVDASRNNYRWSYSASDALSNSRIPTLWRDFVAYHSSPAFFQEILGLFDEEIIRLYPNRFSSPEKLRDMWPGIRGSDRLGDRDILLDAQISGNTPVSAASSVRTTHVDSGDKLFSGLFYLRSDADDSTGGDLTLSRFKPEYASCRRRTACYRGVYVDDRYLEVVETVKYAKNTLILFINSLDSLHGVTPRQPTSHSRLFLNLVGEVEKPLYQPPKRQNPLVKLVRQGFEQLAGAR